MHRMRSKADSQIEDMIAKKHFIQGRLLLAICDSDIKGKIFEDNERILDLSSSYYDGEEMSAEKAETLLQNAETIHAVGEKCVEILIKKKLAAKHKILKVKNIPHVHVYKL